MSALLILAGLALIVGAAFTVSIPVGLACAGLALVFTGWASAPKRKE